MIEFPEVENSIKAGVPFFTASGLPVNLSGAFGLINRISENTYPERDGFDEVVQYFASSRVGFMQAAMLVKSGRLEALRRMAEKNGLDAEVVVFLVDMVLKPAYRAVNLAADRIMAECDWKQGFCPVCGSEPDMARLEADGKRSLHCGLCGREWIFREPACPFCRNDDPDKLSRLTLDNEPGYLVHACARCNRYITTLDAAVLENPAPLDLEKTASGRLDILAVENGFS